MSQEMGRVELELSGSGDNAVNQWHRYKIPELFYYMSSLTVPKVTSISPIFGTVDDTWRRNEF